MLPKQQANRDAANPVVEALMFAIRQGDGIGGKVHGPGMDALKYPSNQARLAQCSYGQIKDIVSRLKAIKPRYPAITKEVIQYVARYPYRKDNANARPAL